MCTFGMWECALMNSASEWLYHMWSMWGMWRLQARPTEGSEQLARCQLWWEVIWEEVRTQAALRSSQACEKLLHSDCIEESKTLLHNSGVCSSRCVLRVRLTTGWFLWSGPPSERRSPFCPPAPSSHPPAACWSCSPSQTCPSAERRSTQMKIIYHVKQSWRSGTPGKWFRKQTTTVL